MTTESAFALPEDSDNSTDNEVNTESVDGKKKKKFHFAFQYIAVLMSSTKHVSGKFKYQV